MMPNLDSRRRTKTESRCVVKGIMCKLILQAENESLLKNLVDKCSNAVLGTVDEIIESLAVPKVTVPRPYSTYTGKLTLGDPVKYPDTSMSIDVQRFFKTKAAKAPSASKFVRAVGEILASDEKPDVDMLHLSGGNDLAAVRNARTYKINDASAPGGKKEVDREELSKGYAYGQTAVAINESEENVTKLETLAGFSIIGFIPREKVDLLMCYDND